MSSFKPTYLYIKTHNTTGLQYFGKTTSKDPMKYKGSGTYWNRHLDKHGNDVTTEILGLYHDEGDCRLDALWFSDVFNIAKSDDWANLMIESLAGGWEYVNSILTKEERSQFGKIGGKIGGNKTYTDKLGWFSKTDQEIKERNINAGNTTVKIIYERYGVKSIFSLLNGTPEFEEKKKETYRKNKHQQGEKNSQFGTMWIKHLDLKISIKISKEELSKYLQEGWIPGRSFFR